MFYSAPFAPKGLWLRSDLSTAQVACPYCESERWEPCKSVSLVSVGKNKFEKKIGGAHKGSTHADRRKAAKKIDQASVQIEVRGPGVGPVSNRYLISLPIPATVEDE